MSNPTSVRPNEPELNAWTLGAIAVVAYCLANVLHEGLGHGGACLLMHGKPRALNAIFFSYDPNSVSLFGRRVIAAGGTVMNLLTGGIALAWFGFSKPRADALRYFLWLFAAVSLSMGFGYLLGSGVLGIGDWVIVFDRLASPLVIRAGLTVVGAILYIRLAPRWLAPGLERFLDRSRPLKPQMRRLTLLPYFVGGFTFLAAGMLNPYGLKLVLGSAVAASFGGTSLLAWCKVPENKTLASAPEKPVALPLHLGWIAAAAIVLAIFVGVLGRGITFHP